MKKLVFAVAAAIYLLLSSCSQGVIPNRSEEESGLTSSSLEGSLFDNDPSSPSRVWIPLGVISGKRPGGSVELPPGFVLTQPLSNYYQPGEGSDPSGITGIAVTIQDTRSPDEIIQRYKTRSGLGSASRREIPRGDRTITAYFIGEWDSGDSTRLLQPEDRYYRHVLEFDEGPYFVSFVYTIKGIENEEAEAQMLSVIDTFRLESPVEEKISRTFDLWSDLGIAAPSLFQQPEDLTAENLRELYTYYCASTHTPVYELSKESGLWEESQQYYRDLYAKIEELRAFGEAHFGKSDWPAAGFLQNEDNPSADPNMVLLDYDSQSMGKRPRNWLNDVYLLDGSMEGDLITLRLRYFYTRTTAMPELESLDCTVTARWTEDGPLFESCRITDTVPAASEPDFTRTVTQLSPEFLSRMDLSKDIDIMDAFYLGLGLEEQGYVVDQEGQVNYTLYTQFTDACSKEMGLPDPDFLPGYSYISFSRRLADGRYQRPFDYYLLSDSTGKIVSLSEEENEILIRGSDEGKENLLKELFE